MSLRFVSVEPSRRCSKACDFCYNGSSPRLDDAWSADELIDFGQDLAKHGVEALSIGGGEPLEWPGIMDALEGLAPILPRSLTSNGLPLEDSALFERLVDAQPDKIHISLHFPDRLREVRRVTTLVQELETRGLRSGINLVVRRSGLRGAHAAAAFIQRSGISNERVVYLPMRGHDTPSAAELRAVAGGPFQSMTCVAGCGPSPRFASVAVDRTVGWCSYTQTRAPLGELTHSALTDAMEGLGLRHCGDGQLIRLGRAV